MHLLITCLIELEPWEYTHLNVSPRGAEAQSSGDRGGRSMAAAPLHAHHPWRAQAARWPLPRVSFICSRSRLFVPIYFKSLPRTRGRNYLCSNSSQDNYEQIKRSLGLPVQGTGKLQGRKSLFRGCPALLARLRVFGDWSELCVLARPVLLHFAGAIQSCPFPLAPVPHDTGSHHTLPSSWCPQGTLLLATTMVT